MRLSRRFFLQAIASASVAGPRIALADPDKKLRILIVGAGPSGLTAAFELTQAGHDVSVFEARARTGGRMYTLHDPFDDGLYAEAGALFLTSNNPGLEYARKFGLELAPISFRTDLGNIARIDGVNVPQVPGTAPKWPLALDEADASLSIQQLKTKYHRKQMFGMEGLSGLLEVDVPGDEFQRLDQMSLADFWRKNGASEAVIQLMRLGYFDGYGNGVDSVSALQLAHEAASFAGSKGAFRVVGGNDRICAELAARLGEPVRLNSPVVAIDQDETRVRVIVESQTGRQEETGDYALITAPLHVQSRINFSPALSPPRAAAIREIAGTDVCRVYVQTRTRFWEKDGFDGSAVTDLPIGSILHSSAGQDGARGILESFTYGARARQMAGLSTTERQRVSVKGISEVYPRIGDQSERSTSYDWGGDPWARGGHAAFAPGQIGRFSRALRKPEGRLYFAGDAIGGVPGYSHSAFKSGIDVAGEIANL